MPRKCVVIGLDAADLDVLRPLLDGGRMPHVARVLAEGAHGVLHSTVPPVSAPAWATFLTGVHPGRHGLYAFVVERPGGATQLASVADIRAPKLWDWCAAQGARAVVANVPVTWPAPAVDATIVTGMLTPEARGVPFTHPPELSDEIRKLVPGYRIDIDRALMEDKPKLEAALCDMNRAHREVFVHLLRTRPWDLFACVFTNTDRGQHAFWRSDRAAVDRILEDTDRHVGAVLAELDLATTTVILMSDHGFCGARWKANVNRILEGAGLLATRRAAQADERWDSRRPDFFDAFQGGRGAGAEAGPGVVGRVLAAVGAGGEVTPDWDATRAFLWSLDSGGVAVNLRSRYPHGSVADEDYESVRDEIVSALKAVRLPDGRRAFRSVRRREDVYRGEFAALAPDVVTEVDDDVDLGMDLDAKEALHRHRRPEGHHSPRGFVAVAGPGVRKGASIEGSIADCLPTVLHAMGLAVPADCDGRVLAGAFEAPGEVRTIDASALGGAGGASRAYTPEEEAEIRRSLEGLGYL